MKELRIMRRSPAILLGWLVAAASVPAPAHISEGQTQNRCSPASMAIQRLNIKVFVTTQPSSIPGRPAVYKEGEFIAGVVWMTNLGDQPVCVCSSSSLYQDRPQLFKDGHEVPYIEGRNEWLGKYWNSEEPCHEVL